MDRSRHSLRLRGLRVGLLAIACAATLASLTSGARAAAKRSLVLEVTVASRRADWRADALARTLTADLADDRLAPRAAPDCRGPCSDDALRAAGVELVVRATLAEAGPAVLGYELRALWPGAPPPVRSAIALAGFDRTTFAGRLRDQLHRLARATSDDTAAPEDRAGELPAPGDIARMLGIALAILAVPIGLGSLRARRLLARRAALRTLAGTAGLAVLGVVLSLLAPPNGHGVLLAAGGLAWAALAAVTIPVVFPPLIGLGRSDYRELLRLFAGWGGLVVRRALAVALIYAPAALAIVLAGDAIIPADDTVQLALVLPLGLLVVRQALRLAIAVLAERLDAQLADPMVDAAAAAAWQAAVRGYLVGYLRRNGLEIDDALLDRLIIVPAASDAVRMYGGGATGTRIAIPRRMLELALAPYNRPHDYAAPRVSTLHWTQWNAGLVMATEPGAAVATREQRQPRETTTEGDPSENAREHLGEPATLIGIIEPWALDPRKSYRPHDDPMWLDWDSGEEYDGTDLGDRDFLFGILAHAIAAIQRHADRFATLTLVLERAGSGIAHVAAPLGRLIERAGDAIADDHTAISGARHHLVQYLAWETWQREDLLTKRAEAPELEATSRRLVAMTEHASRPVPDATRARRRLARLAGLVHGVPAVRSWWRRLALVGAVAAGLGAAALAVVDAVRYHASYEQRQAPHDTERPDHGKD